MHITEMGESQRRQPLTLEEPNRYEDEFPIIKLTREQADMVVRQYADRYYQIHGLDNTERLTGFALWLSWCIGGPIREGALFDVIEAFHDLSAHHAGDRPGHDVDEFESDLNVAVNWVLDSARVSGKWVNRYDAPLGRTA